MKFVARACLAIAAACVVLVPADAEAVSLTFSYCQENDSGLCDSLAPLLNAEVNAGPSVHGLRPGTNDGIRNGADLQSVGPGGQSDATSCCLGTTTVFASEPASMSLFGIAALGAAYGLRRRWTSRV